MSDAAQRFTLDGDPALEAHLETVCERVAGEVRALIPASNLDGLLLGGGYGRGEGGVLRTPDGDRPYNDLEFYVFVRGPALLAERRYRHPLHELGERLSPGAGLEVEFKVLTLEKLRRSGPSMFYYDLVMGHRRLAGPGTLLHGCEHHRDASRIPLHEATRLLMNRGSGLLFSAERLQRTPFTDADRDFVGRNLAKARLALGDVVLTAHGRYDWSCRERHRRLLGHLPDDGLFLDLLRRQHAAGVEFKLHPVRSHLPREQAADEHAGLTELVLRIWLWLEGRRLGVPFATAADYARNPIDKCPETNPIRNFLINLRTFGPAALGRDAFRYPRQRLFHALAWLLGAGGLRGEVPPMESAGRELRTASRDFAGLVSAYSRLWGRFN